MSENLKQNNSNEEVDLGQLFNAIGRLFENLFALIGKIFKGLFSVLIYTLKPIVNNFKQVAIILMTTAIIGLIFERYNEPVYVSDMLVKPYFDSKYQLANNVAYFNALIGARNYEQLSEIFEIDTTTTKDLLGFEMAIGPETQNDLLIYYDDYLKSIDSSLASDVSYEDFIENRDILGGKIFSIKAKANRSDIFTSLDKGFIKTFMNDYSIKLKKIRDSTILIRKAYYERELERVDSLQKVYLRILEKESNRENLSVVAGGMFPITQERTTTREYDLFKEEVTIRGAIRSLDEKLIEESEYYDILSNFEEVGTVESSIWDKYSIILPLISLALMFVLFASYKAFKFIKEYE